MNISPTFWNLYVSHICSNMLCGGELTKKYASKTVRAIQRKETQRIIQLDVFLQRLTAVVSAFRVAWSGRQSNMDLTQTAFRLHAHTFTFAHSRLHLVRRCDAIYDAHTHSKPDAHKWRPNSLLPLASVRVKEDADGCLFRRWWIFSACLSVVEMDHSGNGNGVLSVSYAKH